MIYFMNRVWDPGPAGPPAPQWVSWETPSSPDPTGAAYPDPFGNGFGACSDYRVLGSRHDGADHQTAYIIVGNVNEGDAADICDYLDTGNGEQLAAAITAAAVGGSGNSVPLDVWIRPGEYDLGEGSQAVIYIPEGVRVHGAGRSSVKIVTRTSGDQGAFQLDTDAILEDVGIYVGLPDDVCTDSTSVVSLLGNRAEARRVDVDFPLTWTGTEAALTLLRAAFSCGISGMFAAYDTQFVDCRVGASYPAPWFIDLGLSPGDELVGFHVRTGTGMPRVSSTLARCLCDGGDWSVWAEKPARVMCSTFREFASLGATLYGDGHEVADNSFDLNNSAGLGTERAISLNYVGEASVVDNWIGGRGAGQTAIELIGSDSNTIRGNRGPGAVGAADAVNLDANSDDNIVIGNNFQGDTYTDNGTGNDLAHNK